LLPCLAVIVLVNKCCETTKHNISKVKTTKHFVVIYVQEKLQNTKADSKSKKLQKV